MNAQNTPPWPVIPTTVDKIEAVALAARSAAENPAPDPVTVTSRRMKELTGQVSDAVIAQLSDLRDQLDNLIKAVQERNEKMNTAFEEHATFSLNAIKAKKIIEESVNNLMKDFQNGTDPRATTLTLSANENK